MPPINNCRALLAGDSVDGSLTLHRNCNSSGKHRHLASRFRAKWICKPDTYSDSHRPAARKSFDRGCRSAARARDHSHTDHEGPGCQRTRNSVVDVVDRRTAAVETAMVAQRKVWLLGSRREGSDHRQRRTVANSDFNDSSSATAGRGLARIGSSRPKSARPYHRRQVADRVDARSITNQHRSGAKRAGRRFPESIQLTIVTAAEPDASYCR